MELVEVMPIAHNNTKLVIGQIKHIFLDQECVEEDGNINLSKLGSVCVSGLEKYHRVQQITSLPYAKVEHKGINM
jgi:hypothetical protein